MFLGVLLFLVTKKMEATEKNVVEQDHQDNHPPIFRSWNQMYLFVLVLHAIIIALFYIFTETYS